MKHLFAAGLALALSACAGNPRLDACKGADIRRTAYTATIAAADAWTASHRPVPREVMLARTAAAAALALLDGPCPARR